MPLSVPLRQGRLPKTGKRVGAGSVQAERLNGTCNSGRPDPGMEAQDTATHRRPGRRDLEEVSRGHGAGLD